MLYRIIIGIFFLVSGTMGVFAQNDQQSLFLPLEYQKAYDINTRSKTGAPGFLYWQNNVSYTMDVSVDPENKSLSGTADIQYVNNSDNSLTYIVLRLHQDMYKKGAARDRSIDPEDVTEGVVIHEIRLGKERVDLEESRESRRIGTNIYIRIPNGLASGDSISLLVKWQVSIPKKTRIRMGTLKNNTMFIGYWYPQVSVFDDVDGWDIFNYTARQEFYQQNASYRVNIKLPANYALWATGTLQNPEKIYTKEVHAKLRKALVTDSVYRVFDNPSDGLLAKKGNVEWEFIAEDVPDFAFALSDEHLWDVGSVRVDSISDRRILVHTVYGKSAENSYRHVTKYQQLSLHYFSFVMPGFVYPYSAFTTFQGLKGGGMEFPMMANNGTYSDRDSNMLALRTIEVTAHEIAHTYFPFLVGVNERKNTWMEEGWATFLGEQATSFIQQKLGISDKYSMSKRYASRFSQNEGSIMSVPPMIPSILVREGAAHFHVSYYKAHFALVTLRDLLGEEMFGNALREYINRWKYKNPTPYDFFYTFNDVSGKNLNWFWNSWFFEFGFPDAAIKNVSGSSAVIENKGRLPFPIALKLTYADNSFKKIPISTAEWELNPKEIRVNLPNPDALVSIEILDSIVPDVNPLNDRWEKD